MQSVFQSLRKRVSDRIVDIQYSLFARHNPIAECSQYMNMGYWRGPVANLDQAGKALVHLVGIRADLGLQDDVLDVGFGFGDQDLYWNDTFRPRSIHGVDVAGFQVKVARTRVARRGLNATIHLHRGSGTKLAFTEASFDKVLSVEAAFHFSTREDYFAEAFRVLREGGKLVMTDLLPMPTGDHVLHKVSPKANLYGIEDYRIKLRQVGFCDVAVESIRDDVCIPYQRHVERLLASPEAGSRLSRYARRMLQVRADPRLYSGLDYVIAVAKK